MTNLSKEWKTEQPSQVEMLWRWVESFLTPQLKELLLKIEAGDRLDAYDRNLIKRYLERPEFNANHDWPFSQQFLYKIQKMLQDAKKTYKNKALQAQISTIISLSPESFEIIKEKEWRIILKTQEWLFYIIDKNNNKVLAEWVDSVSDFEEFEIFEKDGKAFALTKYGKSIELDSNYKILHDYFNGPVIYTDKTLYSMREDIQQEMPDEILYFILWVIWEEEELKKAGMKYTKEWKTQFEYRIWQSTIVHKHNDEDEIKISAIYKLKIGEKINIFNLVFLNKNITPTSHRRYWRVKTDLWYGIYDMVYKKFIWEKGFYKSPEIDVEVKKDRDWNARVYLVIPRAIRDRREEQEIASSSVDYFEYRDGHLVPYGK